ncbi:hypothetical protein D3C78_1330320 [compost metagenome]
MLTRAPNVVFRFNQRDGQRESVTAYRLRQAYNIRIDARFFKAEKRSRSATAHLNIIYDKQHAMLAANALYTAQP